LEYPETAGSDLDVEIGPVEGFRWVEMLLVVLGSDEDSPFSVAS
jgi:hypothetical protein